MLPSEFIEEWADEQERREWLQGGYMMHGGACVLGASRYAQIRLGLDHRDQSVILARRIVGDVVKEWAGMRPLPLFNDIPGRTKAEVLDVLRLAAKRARLHEEGLDG